MTDLILPEVRVLDHGFVKLRNLAGPTRRPHLPFDAQDNDPADAARMSFDQAFDPERTFEDDMKLCRYLMENWHTSPFEMIQVWLDMKMPIFVARQFVRHRTVRLNEVSGRYITLPEEWYIPDVVGGKAKNAKQGQADNLPVEVQQWFKTKLDYDCRESYNDYLQAIHAGVAAEHARMFLHVNHYTHWLWNQDLHNFFHFLKLRDHYHAQIEAQHYARGADSMVRQLLPRTFELYDEYRRMKKKTQAGWLLNHKDHEAELVPFDPHGYPLTDADVAAGWMAEPLFLES